MFICIWMGTLIEIGIGWCKIPIFLRNLTHKPINRWYKPRTLFLVNHPIWINKNFGFMSWRIELSRNTSDFLVFGIFAPLDKFIDFLVGLKEWKPMNTIHNSIRTWFRKILKFSVRESNQWGFKHEQVSVPNKVNPTCPNNVLYNYLRIPLNIDTFFTFQNSVEEIIPACIHLWFTTINENCMNSSPINKSEMSKLSGHFFDSIP